jgi:hypothetical protein
VRIGTELTRARDQALVFLAQYARPDTGGVFAHDQILAWP